ncbi:hypothetical protein R3P38DRAFT_3342695 [Favolaschia claudopus]|uniref:Uncharacterized protein n=1 Tax=Favolaschia claudopus TaxID=2862362 RepID=A0AAW0DVL1_9AGAR
MQNTLDPTTLEGILAQLIDDYAEDEEVTSSYRQEVAAQSPENLKKTEKMGRALGQMVFQQQLRIAIGYSSSAFSSTTLSRHLFESSTLLPLVISLAATTKNPRPSYDTPFQFAAEKVKPLVDGFIAALEIHGLMPPAAQASDSESTASPASTPAPATEEEQIVEFWTDSSGSKKRLIYLYPAMDGAERAQNGILSRMDLKSYKVARLLRINSPAICAEARSEEGRAVFRGIGTSALEYFFSSLLRDWPFTPEQYDVVEKALKSDLVVARVLLGTGVYQKVKPCPWFGLSSPAPKAALEVFIGAYIVWVPDDGARRLQNWFLTLFTPLLKAAAHALESRFPPRKPLIDITCLTDLDRKLARRGASVKAKQALKPKNVKPKNVNNLNPSTQPLADVGNAGKKVPAAGKMSRNRENIRPAPYKSPSRMRTSGPPAASTTAQPTSSSTPSSPASDP